MAVRSRSSPSLLSMSMLTLSSILLVLVALVIPPSVKAAAFLPVTVTSAKRMASSPQFWLSDTSTALHAKKKKLSMAEKLRQRAKRLPPRPLTITPNTTPRPDAPTLASTTKSTTSTSKSNSAVTTPNANANDDDTMTKAQQLLQSQRKSVAMLTLVRERLEALPAADIQSALANQGFWYSDNSDTAGFLQSPDMLQELQQEGVFLYESGLMSVDVDRLATGEYCCALAGGQDQYVSSPRSIELVVSTTKHLSPAVLLKDTDVKGAAAQAQVVLDDTKCMASMRTFDRKARQAAQVLLTGSTGSTDNDDADNGDNDSDNDETTPFGRTVTGDIDGQPDRRKISLCYYLVPDHWSHGGDMVFQQSNNGDGNEVRVPAVRDRLVIWKSDTTMHRQEPWKGSDDMPLASCIELHLIEKV